MVFHCALADAEIGGDVLAGMAGKNHLHDLTLPRSERGDVAGRILAPGQKLACIPRVFRMAIDVGKQFSAADRLLDEVGRASLHGFHRDRDVAVAR